MWKMRAMQLLHSKGSHLRRYTGTTLLDVSKGAWAAPQVHQKLLGNRVLVVNMGDPASEEHAKHMLSELQTLGMQGHRVTMLQSVPHQEGGGADRGPLPQNRLQQRALHRLLPCSCCALALLLLLLLLSTSLHCPLHFTAQYSNLLCSTLLSCCRAVGCGRLEQKGWVEQS